MKLRVDFSDPWVRTSISLLAPICLAIGVLVWGYRTTENHAAVPDPRASAIIALSGSTTVLIPPTQRPATATPGLGPGTAYRIEGVVVDVLGVPIQDVCIAIGPNGCQEHSPRSDERGVYYIDFPKADVSYDLHFTKDGYKEFSTRINPNGDQVLNLVLAQ